MTIPEILKEMEPYTGKFPMQAMREAIEQRDYDVFHSRVTLSGWRKLGLVVQAVPTRLGWAGADG